MAVKGCSMDVPVCDVAQENVRLTDVEQLVIYG